MRWLTNFCDFRFKWTATAGIGIHPSKAWFSQLVNFKYAIWHFRRTLCNKILFLTLKKCHAIKAGSTSMSQRPRDRVPSGSMQALPDPRRPERANSPTNFWWSLFLTALTWSTCARFPLDRQSTRNTVKVLREFRKRFRRKWRALFKSGQWYFHQDNAPVHSSILGTDYLTSYLVIKTVPHRPYSPDLVLCN